MTKETKTTKETTIGGIATDLMAKAAESQDSADALRWSQAACNAAHVTKTLIEMQAQGFTP